MVRISLRKKLFGPAALAGLLLASITPRTSAADDDPGARARAVWNAHVESIFTDYCTKCHAGVKQKGGVDLRTPENILKGGDEGAIVIPGDSKNSRLFKSLAKDADPHMPPAEMKQLNEEQIAMVQRWIDRMPSTNGVAGPPWENPAYAARKPLKMPAWSAKTELSAGVDRFIQDGWKTHKVKPAAKISDAGFARRVYLDLIGRIPTESELAAFEKLPAKNRRETLVDQLLASKEYAIYMAEIFDVTLMGRKSDVAKAHRNQKKEDEKWERFLETAFEKNRPWNEIVRQIIVARPEKEEDIGAEWYLYERKDNYQAMAEALGPVGFGVSIKCAQCHNHPLSPEIEQRHYWGVVSAFNRGKNVDTKAGRGISESAIGGFVSFSDLRKRTMPAELVFPNGKSVPETRPAPDAKEVDNIDLYVIAPPKEKEKAEKPATPKFSRRAELANAICHDNPMLAKAFVNRVWALFMGRGLVHPVESLDSRHPASHPELLEFLAADFTKHNYDIKRLARGLALSRVYQLDSKGGSPNAAPENFARALDKPLLAEALYRSVVIAATGGTNFSAHAELRGALVERFPDLLPAEYNATLHQATFLSNNPKLAELLRPEKENATAAALQEKTPEDRARFLFRRALQRDPDKDESTAAVAFLQSGPPETRVPELMWTLLASAEFQFNH